MDALIYRARGVYAFGKVEIPLTERDNGTIVDAYFFEQREDKVIRQETMTADSGLMLKVQDAAGKVDLPIKCKHTIGNFMLDTQFKDLSQIRGTPVIAYTNGAAIVGIRIKKERKSKGKGPLYIDEDLLIR